MYFHIMSRINIHLIWLQLNNWYIVNYIQTNYNIKFVLTTPHDILQTVFPSTRISQAASCWIHCIIVRISPVFDTWEQSSPCQVMIIINENNIQYTSERSTYSINTHVFDWFIDLWLWENTLKARSFRRCCPLLRRALIYESCNLEGSWGCPLPAGVCAACAALAPAIGMKWWAVMGLFGNEYARTHLDTCVSARPQRCARFTTKHTQGLSPSKVSSLTPCEHKLTIGWWNIGGWVKIMKHLCFDSASTVF